jgi:hypothetical protein
MRGRVISVLIVLLSTTFSVIGSDCSWALRYSGQFRATVFDVAADADGFVWVANGYGVQLFEPIAGRGYAYAGSVALPGSTRVVALNGSIAYAGSGAHLVVLRRSGRTLSVVRSLDLTGTVNDIVVAPSSFLYVATSAGIIHYRLIDPASPDPTGVVLTTSRADVASLALLGNTLYAADGDATVEFFTLTTPSFPQRTGALDSLPRSSAVHTTASNVFVSDDLGQNTDIFAGTTRIARIAYGTNAFAPLTADSFFGAGPQRTFRAIDISAPARVAELYSQQLLPLGGTTNRIFAMARSGNTLLVAAGDMGLVTYDIATLAAPHPLVSYSDGAKSSALAIGDKAYFADGSTISEASINRAGLALTPARSWNAASPVLHDTTTTSLATSGDTELRIWSVDTATPATTFTSTFPANIRSAVLANNSAIANLTDDSVWRVSLSGVSPQQVALNGAKIRFLGRSGNAVALVQITDDAKTNVRYFANGDVTSAPRIFTLDGAAIGGVALNTTTAAVFTFRGLNLIDLTTGVVRVLPASNRLIPKQLLFSGSDLLILGEPTLAVWDTAHDTLLREHSLPASPRGMSVTNGVAVIASSAGSMAIAYAAALPKPIAISGSRFYKDVAAAGNYLYLFEDARVDAYWTGNGAAPAFLTNIAASGAIDIAALPQTLYALGSFGTITAYSTAGAQLAQITLNEGGDAQPLAITTAGNAVWVSLVKGCSGGNCEWKTLVLDPTTLVVTATLSGEVKSVVTSGTRAYALFASPDEIRVLDITNPLQPSQVIQTPSPGNASDIGYSNGKVYVVAGRVFAYNESLLASGELLDPINATQKLAVEGDCAVITGRSESPQLFTLSSWAPSLGTQPQIPSPVRLIAQQPGRLFLLTDHSIEVWTTAPPPVVSKRRAAR